jgi:hypothetical protein
MLKKESRLYCTCKGVCPRNSRNGRISDNGCSDGRSWTIWFSTCIKGNKHQFSHCRPVCPASERTWFFSCLSCFDQRNYNIQVFARSGFPCRHVDTLGNIYKDSQSTTSHWLNSCITNSLPATSYGQSHKSQPLVKLRVMLIIAT